MIRNRYRALRLMGCGWFTSFGISFMNWAIDYPTGMIGFMNVIIDYDPEEVDKEWSKK